MAKRPFSRSWIMLAAMLSVWAPLAAQAQNDAAAPVSFSADSLQHDDRNRIVTASGHVELEQAGRILKADQIVYNMADDTVTAHGNVVLLETNGDVHFADDVQFTDEMKDGYVKKLRTTLHDGSRFWAAEGNRKGGTVTTMKQAGYTPCEPCLAHPEADPAWQILADEVRHDEDAQRISYRNATMEMWGVPVLYTPYFSHPDGSVKRKSGFLTPSVGYNSDLGAMITNQYYMALSPHYDATLGMTLMTNQSPLLSGEYRHRFEDAALQMRGSVTHSSRTDDEAGTDIQQGDELRGHLFADGLWDINRKWRAGLGVEFASDDQYLRQYDFSGKDVLENEVYLERFSGRNYSVARALAFQDVRSLEEKRDQPDVLPEIQMGFLGDPGQTLGGRWSADLSLLNLRREAGGQDMDRVVAQAGWQRRLVSDTGLLTTADLKLRGDAYHVRDRDIAPAGSGRSGDGSEARGFAQAHLVASYPLVKPLRKAQVVIEPVAALSLAPNIHSESSNIPNEDSQDVQLDSSNLFEADRFPGLDRIEDESRATYGLRTGAYGYGGSKGEIFLGQSYRFDAHDNPFPAQSGLSDQRSDLVGQVTAAYKDRYTLDYRFQLDNNDYASRRHEVEAGLNVGKIQMGARYLYAKAVEDINVDDDREQAQGNIAYQMTDEWRVRSSVIQDLGNDPGMRRADFGFDYQGQCLTFSGTLERNLARESSGDSNTEVMFRMGFRNIGEFTTSGISLNRSEDKGETPIPAP